MNTRTDILIVGAGPAGLSAAINASARGKSVRLLSAGSTILSRAETVDNYLGLYHVTGSEMMQHFEDHAAKMGISVEKGRVGNIMPFDSYFMVNFNGDIVESRSIILATGIAKAREIPGETALLGRGVSYCATCDGMLYRSKKVIVWGLASDAVEEANFLNHIGVNVTFIALGERPKELDSAIAFQSGKLKEIIGDESVTAAATETETIRADGVFILRNSIAPTSLIAGLELENGYIKVNRSMETNIPGLFAAGDCTGIPLQIANAVGDGLIAAQQAARYLDSQKSTD